MTREVKGEKSHVNFIQNFQILKQNIENMVFL